MAKILIVEDERAIADLIALNLQMVGHETMTAQTGAAAKRLFRENAFDLLLLDVMLPDTDGFALYGEIHTAPAIFVTGFRLGADDYLVKPFAIPELLMRVGAVLRRTQRMEDRYAIGDVEVDFHGKTVRKGGEIVELTAQEYALLEILIRNRNIAVSRQQILREAWGMSYYGETRTIDVHVQRLRKKLDLGDRIQTVYKYGYRFEDNT